MKKLIFVVIISIMSLSQVSAQISSNRSAWLQAEIFDIVKPVIGDNSRVMSVVEMDSAKTDIYQKNDFKDPYGTLTGCVLFSCGPETPQERISLDSPGNYWVGIFKENEVIWLSESVYKGPMGGDFQYTLDINNDGNVEIIHTWETFDIRGTSYSTYLHIISWDGEKGVFLNEGGIDTKIKKYRGYFEAVDLNGDNTLEFVTDYWEFNETTSLWDSSKAVFCWNGSLYGEWADCPLWPDQSINPYYPFTAANNFQIELNTEVISNEDTFEYSVNVKNLPESNQNIRQFFFKNYAESLLWLRPTHWGGTVALNGELVGATAIQDTQIILPGKEENFAYLNSQLPKIADCYFLAAYQNLDIDLVLGDDYLSYRDKNIINNSVKGTILSPAPPPEPFIPTEFLDTLVTYVDSSYSLGWIKNEGILNSLQVKLNNAKKQLEKNKTKQTINLLNAFVNEVEAQNGKKLTSEAYALLKYNAEYLIEQLSD